MEKATLCYRIYKIWQILKRFAGTFRQAQNLKLGGVDAVYQSQNSHHASWSKLIYKVGRRAHEFSLYPTKYMALYFMQNPPATEKKFQLAWYFKKGLILYCRKYFKRAPKKRRVGQIVIIHRPRIT